MLACPWRGQSGLSAEPAREANWLARADLLYGCDDESRRRPGPGLYGEPGGLVPGNERVAVRDLDQPPPEFLQ